MIGQIAKINDQMAVISGLATRRQTLKTLNSSANAGSCIPKAFRAFTTGFDKGDILPIVKGKCRGGNPATH